MAEKDIRSSQEVAQDMNYLQIEVCKVEQPSCLVMVKVLGLMEVCQVLVVSKDLDREGGSMEVVSPGFQSMDNGKEFTVIDVIVSFSQDKQLREIQTGVSVTIGVGLKKDGIRGVLRSICGNGKGLSEVGEVEDRV